MEDRRWDAGQETNSPSLGPPCSILVFQRFSADGSGNSRGARSFLQTRSFNDRNRHSHLQSGGRVNWMRRGGGNIVIDGWNSTTLGTGIIGPLDLRSGDVQIRMSFCPAPHCVSRTTNPL
jgi:hypothetical protein